MDIDRRDFLLNSARVGAFALGSTTLWQTVPAMGQTSKGMELATMTIIELSRLLAAQKITSRQLVEQSLAAINDARGEGARTFLLVHEKEALAAAGRIDAERRRGAKLSALAGIPISIKDLFDEEGVVTLGGSKVMVGTPPATHDSTVVERLKKAGVVIIGRTNMTEFAFSGLGVNPHYGTPKNAFDRTTGRIPGGSSSGAAISVTDAMAAGAIGTDTGGSVRIPAALNGLCGFKPTARRVSREGVMPLSFTLDSVGPIAKSVADCALLDQILSGETGPALKSPRLSDLSFAVPKTLFQDDLSPSVAKAFAAALGRLASAGAKITELPMAEFAQRPRGLFSSSEAYYWHRKMLVDGADKYDPRVISRIRSGETITAADYVEAMQSREKFIRTVNAAASGYDAMLMPTTPETAPTLAEVIKDDESYFRFNSRMLRNPAVVNLFDGCALSIPCHEPGSAPVGLMVTGMQMADKKILSIGLAVERIVWTQGK